MAGYNEILEARFNRMVQKFLAMKGPASMNELSTTLQTSLNVFSGAENRFLESWQRYGARISIPAGGAGFFSVARFKNPNGSNVIAVMERLTVVEAAGDNPTLFISPGTNQPNLALVGTQSSFDARGPANAMCSLTGKNGDATAGAGTIIWTGAVTTSVLQADAIITDMQELTCVPNTSYDVQCVVANQGMTVSVWWRERLLGESERF